MTRLTSNERAIVVTALRHAVPYLRVYKRKVFVLKAGGDAFVSPETTRALMEQIGILHQVGIRVVLVHGGGPQSTRAVEAARPADHDGRRPARHGCANARSLDDGAQRRDQHADRRRVPRVGRARDRRQRRRRRAHQGDQAAAREAALAARPWTTASSATSTAIDASIIRKQLDNDLVPIVSPLSADDHGVLLNINADTVAAAIACELKAREVRARDGRARDPRVASPIRAR